MPEGLGGGEVGAPGPGGFEGGGGGALREGRRGAEEGGDGDAGGEGEAEGAGADAEGVRFGGVRRRGKRGDVLPFYCGGEGGEAYGAGGEVGLHGLEGVDGGACEGREGSLSVGDCKERNGGLVGAEGYRLD